jgi:hypothetical protein
MNEWFFENVWITYTIIFLLVTYVYNRVFRVRKLPMLKNVIVYSLIGIGSFLLLFFQMMGLPIILSLAVAMFLMLIFRVRTYIEKWVNKKEELKRED